MDFERVVFVNAWLTMMSGIVNAVAFLEMGMTVSHHTGNATHWGRLTGSSHVTGYVTDAGAILGTWVSASIKGAKAPSLKKPAIFLIPVCTFALGGLVTANLKEVAGLSMLLVAAFGTSLMALGMC
eukprot:TRINITY_DN42878_c0_g1_i4.p2 TRINITY_DN42878_c0_g1~~TRINITY_DN42878_c0_g1_i4.p2  ORF type:complete len:126 (+),score=16.75 TRINITY_DN42878_c0_g1_i4:156-533(+)